ncbi:putative epoxide hydrolase [Gordonia araii NBRC 100433]|uniref:Putative epoxide hydrolase n=1 Tax=Gordonia araii NBRC 100433 TaxID=1073574 RepID=G7H4Z7_9ACTN|nr:alpha/beta hydrolase [Gordonia araii]NNG96612.1 alpha/beta hydrolase [Gordonia araii NBRC 100433]GAB10922.1 putative epoxide hydrolase [Gordonia araii NBRC 100433]
MTTTKSQIHLGDLAFDVAVGGPEDGAPVLLLHGFPHDSACFDGVLEPLHDAGLRTITFDQRGYSPGARPADVDDYGLDHLVGDAIGVLDHLGVERCLLVGHDWGGIVGWHLAARHPERFTGYVAVSTGHPSAVSAALVSGSDQRERSAYIKTFTSDEAEEKLLARNAVLLRRTCPRDAVVKMQEPGALTAALNWYRATFSGDIATKTACGRVTIPTTMVWSDADSALGREQAEGSGDFVDADYRFVELTGVDHWVPENAPQELAAAIIARANA